MTKLTIMAMTAMLASACNAPKEESSVAPWSMDRFADIEEIRYEDLCYESQSLQQKKLDYY